MRLKEGFVLRTICGRKVLSGEGTDRINYCRLLSLNETAAYLWESLKGKEFDAKVMARLLTDKFDVDEDSAIADCEGLCRRWKEAGIAE